MTPAALPRVMPWPCKLILAAFAPPLAVLLVAGIAAQFFGVRFGAADGSAVIWLFFSLLTAVGVGGTLQAFAVWRAERLFEAAPQLRTGIYRAIVVTGMVSAAFAGMYLLIFALTWR